MTTVTLLLASLIVSSVAAGFYSSYYGSVTASDYAVKPDASFSTAPTNNHTDVNSWAAATQDYLGNTYLLSTYGPMYQCDATGNCKIAFGTSSTCTAAQSSSGCWSFRKPTGFVADRGLTGKSGVPNVYVLEAGNQLLASPGTSQKKAWLSTKPQIVKCTQAYYTAATATAYAFNTAAACKMVITLDSPFYPTPVGSTTAYPVYPAGLALNDANTYMYYGNSAVPVNATSNTGNFVSRCPYNLDLTQISTFSPTVNPTMSPTLAPTPTLSAPPTMSPSAKPSAAVTGVPSPSPSAPPTVSPTKLESCTMIPGSDTILQVLGCGLLSTLKFDYAGNLIVTCRALLTYPPIILKCAPSNGVFFTDASTCKVIAPTIAGAAASIVPADVVFDPNFNTMFVSDAPVTSGGAALDGRVLSCNCKQSSCDLSPSCVVLLNSTQTLGAASIAAPFIPGRLFFDTTRRVLLVPDAGASGSVVATILTPTPTYTPTMRPTAQTSNNSMAALVVALVFLVPCLLYTTGVVKLVPAEASPAALPSSDPEEIEAVTASTSVNKI